ncbi:PQQ-binding-like beta-propeller repeat protein [Oerskovia sp. NPDC060338]|uniref:outer membrane protein assembly factor BamB family protein n=1 Tax=Oerskovia sp. NPDC060338 TaxID=3347100 RepID=UPI00365C60A1
MRRRAKDGSEGRMRSFALEEAEEDVDEPARLLPRGTPTRGAGQGGVPDDGARLLSVSHGPASPDVPGRARSGRRPSRRTRALLGAAIATVVVLVVGGLVVGERNEAARIERVLASSGGVRSLGPDVAVVWRIAPVAGGNAPDLGRWSQPTVVDGVLVVPGDPVAGYDPTTGERLWRASESPESSAPTEDAPRSGDQTRCSGSGPRSDRGPVVCTTSSFRPVTIFGETSEQAHLRRIEVVDPVTGDVLTSRSLDEETTGATVAFTDGLATFAWGSAGQVVVTLEDLATGEVRWSRELVPGPEEGVEGPRYLQGWPDGDALRVEATGLSVTLAADGSSVSTRQTMSWDSTLPDGGRVSLGGDGTWTVFDPDGHGSFSVAGNLVLFDVTDGSADVPLLVSEGGDVMDAAGTIARPVFSALDRRTGRTLWTADGNLERAVAQVGDVGVLSGAGRLWGVDLATGERVWEAGGTLAYGQSFTDGTDLYLVGQSGIGATRVTAISVDSGQELWATEVPELSTWTFSARGRLVLVTDDGGLLGLG